MHKPKLLIFIGGCSLLLITAISCFHSSPSHNKPPANHKEKIFDVASGDTNNEVLKTIVANQQKLQAANRELTAQNTKLRSQGMTNLQNIIKQTTAKLNRQLTQTKQTLEAEINNRLANKNVYQLTKQEQEQEQEKSRIEKPGIEKEKSEKELKQISMIGKVQDLAQPPATSDKTDIAVSTADQPPQLPSDLSDTTNNEQKNQQKSIAYYTIPANSTLNNTVLMSSIIAEVPVAGHLLAPAFPFKAIIGSKELFAANGVSLPKNIAGMVLEGYSVGNMTLSCAQAYVTRALFVFRDGHFQVYPAKDNNSATELYPKNSLGYLSDIYGNPCISGKYITDAPKVIANMAALGGVAGGAQAVSQAQMSGINNAFQVGSQLTGSLKKYLAGATISNAAQKTLAWYNSRVDDIFDAVYIPAAKNHHPTKLVFNISKTIPINFNKNSRKLSYANNQQNSFNNNFD